MFIEGDRTHTFTPRYNLQYPICMFLGGKRQPENQRKPTWKKKEDVKLHTNSKPVNWQFLTNLGETPQALTLAVLQMLGFDRTDFPD